MAGRDYFEFHIRKATKQFIFIDSKSIRKWKGFLRNNSPQILRGASNSNKIGWLRKISLDFKQSPLTSASVNWTFLPGLEPRTTSRNTNSCHKILLISAGSLYKTTRPRHQGNTNNLPSKSLPMILSTFNFSVSDMFL